MFSTVICRSLCLYLVLAAGAPAEPGIVVGPSAPELELYAAGQLRSYLVRLYGGEPSLARTPRPSSIHILVGSPSSNPAVARALPTWPKLSDQGIVLKSASLDGTPAIVLGGGSPAATLWAVYEFLERLGVRFLLEKDVLPEKPAVFPPANLDVIREPQLRFRSYRGVNDLATSLVFYGLKDYRHLIDQLAKLKFNVFYVQTYPFQPFVDYQFRGQKKTTGVLHYGWKLPVHALTIGRDLFGGRSEMENPELEGAHSYEERVAAASRMLHQIFAYAKSRGMKTGLMFWINQFPSEFSRRLPEWSDHRYVPMELIKGTRNARLGVSEDGVDPESFPYMTPNNPVVMELNKLVIRAHIDSYPEVDYYGLFQPELPKAGDEYKASWARLNRKYGLEPKFSLEHMVTSAKTNTLPVGVRVGERPFRELQAAIGYADTVDKLLNEYKVLEGTANPHATVVVSTFSDEFYPVLAKIFPRGVMQQVAMDYLSSLAAERTEMLSFAAKTPMRVAVMASLADDNIGILPQLPTPSLHRIFQSMKSYGVEGFFGRQFLVTKLEAATAYVAQAAWSPDVTPEQVYRDQVQAVCGPGAVDDMLRAYGVIEKASFLGDQVAMGFLFPVPTMMQRHWRSRDGANAGWDRLTELYRQAVTPVRAAREKSRAGGQSYLDQLAGQLAFSTGYIEAVQEVRRARQAYDRAQKARTARSVAEYDTAITETNQRLDKALGLLKAAIEAWAGVVRDPSDLGALAVLNSYCYDYLKGVAHDVYLESQIWSIHQ